MEYNIDPDNLSFNLLPEDVAREYLMENGHFHNPFDLPDGVFLINPFTGIAMRYNADTPKSPTTNPPELNGERIIRNPFNSKIISKLLYENGIVIKKWGVSDDNEWIEEDLEKKYGI